MNKIQSDVVGATLWSPPPATPPRRPRGGRLLRVGLAIVALCIVAGFAYERFFEVASSSAVLTGVDVVLRAPIDGVVSGGDAAVSGSLVEAGQKIIQLTNYRVDTRRLNELIGAAHTARGEISAIRMRLSHSIAEAERTSTSSEHFQQARIEQLRARVVEADAEIRSAEARLREARSGLERSETLLAAHAGTKVIVEQYQRMRDVAEADLASARQRKALRNIEMEAAEKGVFTTDAANDRSASQQAQDRVRHTAQELTALLSERETKAEALETQAMAERSLLDRLSLADVTVQRRSRVIQPHVQPGDFIKQGEPLVSMIDCAQPVVLAEIDESKFRALSMDMSATFTPGNVLTRFDSEAPRFHGQVVQLLTPLTEDVNNSRSATYRVVVRLDASVLADRCEARLMGNVRFFKG